VAWLQAISDIGLVMINDVEISRVRYLALAEYVRRKATDYDRWLRGMRRLQASFNAETPLKQ